MPAAGASRARSSPGRTGSASAARMPLGEPLWTSAGVGHVLDQDGELVAAEPGRGVTGRRPPASARRPRRSSASPAACPEVSLTTLKSSRSSMSTTSRPTAAAEPGQGVLRAVAEQHPVGQSGERVVERLVGQLGLEPAPLGDVAHRKHHAGRRSGRPAGCSPPPRRSGGRRPGAAAASPAPAGCVPAAPRPGTAPRRARRRRARGRPAASGAPAPVSSPASAPGRGSRR